MLDKDAQRADPQGSPPLPQARLDFCRNSPGFSYLGQRPIVFSRTGQFRGFTGIPGGGGRKEQTDLDIVWLPMDPCRMVGRTVNFCLDSEGSGVRTGLGWTRNARHTVGLYIGKLLFPGTFPFWTPRLSTRQVNVVLH